MESEKTQKKEWRINSLIEILDIIDTCVMEVQEEGKKNGAGKNSHRNNDWNVPKMMQNINLHI